MSLSSNWRKRARLDLYILAAAFATSGLLRAQTAPDLNRYVGQSYILRGRGSANEIKLRAADIRKPDGTCDAAVSVSTAALEKSEIHLVLEPIGIVHYPKGASTCVRIPSQVRVILSSLAGTSAEDVSKTLDGFLMSPEAYIASFGDKFDYPGGDNPDSPVVPLSTPNVSPPKPVLSVDASYTDAARRAHVSGTVVAEVTVGRDGRAALGNLVKGLGYELDEQVLRVLTLWRFTPAQLDDKAVAVRVSLEMTFNVQ